MPRLVEAMKDVLGCDKPRGAAKKLWSGDFRMGQPSMEWFMLPFGGRTQGSETSQYLKEKKSIDIPKVAASEMGTGLLVIAIRLVERSGKFGHSGWYPRKRKPFCGTRLTNE